jgi:hypothetical protein
LGEEELPAYTEGLGWLLDPVSVKLQSPAYQLKWVFVWNFPRSLCPLGPLSLVTFKADSTKEAWASWLGPNMVNKGLQGSSPGLTMHQE